MKIHKILVINPGSTSTKIAVFRDNERILIKSIRHNRPDLAAFKSLYDQWKFRKNVILSELGQAGINLNEITAVIGRGGFLKPIESGIYTVNEQMKADLRSCRYGVHASNLGGLLADEIARSLPGRVKAFIADPVVVDEMHDVARIAGHPRFTRKSVFHALNQKAIARIHAKAVDRPYEEMNLILVHLGGGISVGAHRQGRVIDVNQALDGSGPMAPERSGSLPVGDLVDFCFSGEATREEVRKMITGEGGYVAYFGTNDAYEIELRAQSGDARAALIQEAMAYQVAKEIGAMATVLKGKVDYIVLTGGVAHNNHVVDAIKEMTGFIAPVAVYPGEDEMHALASIALRAMKGEVKPKTYA